MNPLQKIYWIGKGVGWDNVPRRLYQSARIRTGALRRQMAPRRFKPQAVGSFLSDEHSAQANWQNRRNKFFPDPTAEQLHDLIPEPMWQATVGKECEAALNGAYPFFSRWTGELGWPPNFNSDPVNQIEWPVGKLWLDTARSGPPRNDIKLVWEASRLTLAYTLARHYIYTKDELWAEAFWEMFDAWRQQNPVNESVAWGCGQEVAFRLMAALFATMTTLGSDAATPTRLQHMEQFCYQSGMRIDANINYALSQKNNHGISEALGLFTVGLLFPNFPQSATWVNRGHTLIEQEVARQVYDDGSYVQHSMSYHRVMLDDLCWVIALGRIHAQEFSPATLARVAAATRWLSEFVEPATGRVPNYGSNDGANVLPLSCTDYLDYRPTLQLAASLCNLQGLVPTGVWSEKTLWLTGKCPSEPSRATRAERWQATDGGYYILRGTNSQLMIRAPRYRDRPGQCDTLHVDLWYGAENVVRDAGSFRYYHEDKTLKNYFYSTAAHNTVSVPGTEQMTKGPNFLWLDWPKVTAEFDRDGKLMTRAQFFSKIPYEHARVISRDGNAYTVEDTVSGNKPYSVNWRLTPEWEWQQTGTHEYSAIHDDQRYCIRWETSGAVDIELSRCWEAPYYGERTEVPRLAINGIVGTISTQFVPCRN